MQKRNKRFCLLAVGLLLAVSLVWLNWPAYKTLLVLQGDTQRVLLSIPLDEDNRFSIRYIHSIHRTPVMENYHVDDSLNIVVDEVMFDSYGVGMPSELEPGETFTERDGKFVIGNINRKLPFFDQRIGQEVAAHTLLVQKREIPLARVSPPGTWVRFQAVRQTPWQRILLKMEGRFMHGATASIAAN